MTAKRISSSSAALAVTLAAGGLLVGCGTQQAARVASVTDKEDAQIATAGLVYNEGEVRQGRIAVERAATPEVRQYAQRVVEGHEKALEDTRELMKEQRLQRDTTPTVAALEERVEMQNERLREMSGQEFDRQFIDYQIELHETSLTAIEEDYLKDAEDPEVRAILDEYRGMIRDHLEEARALRDRLDERA